MALGDGIRRNIAHVDPTERAMLRDAILQMHQRFYPGNRGDTPPGGVSWWFKQDEIHAHTHVHECPAFLPWHRELINRFEASLREINPMLSLHYWDWTTDPSWMFTSDFMGNAHTDAGEPWQANSAPWRPDGFYVPTASPFRSNNEFDPNNNPVDPPRNLTRNVRPGAPMTVQEDRDIVNAATYQALNGTTDAGGNFQEGLLTIAHNKAHGFIGGTIGNAHTSFRDPFVFLLHSNVDRLFALWQLQPGKEWRLDPNLVYGLDTNTKGSGDVESGDPFWGILSPMEPWAGTAAQTTETGVIANVRATRPWGPPENEQLRPENQKDSRHPTIVTPPRYDTNPLQLSGLVGVTSGGIILGAVGADGGGAIIVGGRIIPIPPWDPMLGILKQIALFGSSELTTQSSTRDAIRREALTAITDHVEKMMVEFSPSRVLSSISQAQQGEV